MTKSRLIVLIILIVAGGWYLSQRSRKNPPSQEEGVTAQAPASAVTKTTPTAGEGEETAEETADESAVQNEARVHYFTKEALESCSTETVTFAQVVDPSYGHPVAGALVAMTRPLPKDAPEGYVSALASGTRLITMRIDKEGVAHADYNKKLNEDLGDCRADQRRAQIVSTAKEFSVVKDVVITVNGKAWE